MTLEVSTEATSPLPKVSKKDRKDRKSKKSASALLDEVVKTVLEPEAATPALSTAPESGEPHLEKPKKIKKTKGLALVQLDGSVDNAPSSSDPSTLPSDTVSLEEPSEPKKSKKRKHKEALSDATEALIAALESIPESDEEKQQQPTLTVTNAPSGVEEALTKKKKKDKRTSKDAVAEVPEEGGEPKKRKKSSKYPNPAEDSELSDQAQKAIGYANSFVNDKATWKFNKAMQNWLVRNFWSETSVPEQYTRTVTKYLCTIQGGARENLIAKARELASPSVKENIAPAAPVADVALAPSPAVAAEPSPRAINLLAKLLKPSSD